MTGPIIDFGTGDQDFTDNIAPKEFAHSQVVEKTEFAPWHKPRKHWLRVNQWNVSIAGLIEKLKLGATTRPLKYLSLPGPDLLDVRAIQPLCAGKNVTLRFLGLNHIGVNQNAVEREQALSLSEVRSLPMVDPESAVYLDKFEHIANLNSIAYGRVIKDKASFDVVNVDLCSSFANSKPGEEIPNYYNAMFKLLRHQADTRTDDWLFFLTTRTNKDKVNTQIIEKFWDFIDEMLATDPGMQDTLIEKGIFAEAAFLDGKINRAAIDPHAFANSFLLGVGKWIVSAMLKHSPRWKVSTLPVYSYHVATQDSACDMASLGFYCTKILEVATDTLGLAGAAANANVQPPEIAGQASIRRLLDRVAIKTDIDVMLENDTEQYLQSLEHSVILMKAARYSETHYREWAESERNKLIPLLKMWGLLTEVAAA